MKTFDNVFQPTFNEILNNDFYIKGKWHEYFGNDRDIVLELGCGKGEYTVKLAEMFPEVNYIGVDIKGARMWAGARYALQQQLINVAFIRTRIEFIGSFFANDEISEIWLTFPDPQLKKRRNKKRLTGPKFLNSYQKFLIDGGLVHLKTDNPILYKNTLDLIEFNDLELVLATGDLYRSGILDKVLSIKTFYEAQFLREGLNIHYLKFKLTHGKNIEEPE